MRTDLIRVHSGEAPEAPKVFTDAERTSLLSAAPPGGRNQPTERIPAHQPTYTPPKERNPPSARWLDRRRGAGRADRRRHGADQLRRRQSARRADPDVQGPEARRRRGRRCRTSASRPTSTSRPTRPSCPASSSAPTRPPTPPRRGTTRSRSTCRSVPSSARCPTSRSWLPRDAERKLKDAGFDQVKQVPGTSAPEDKGRVTATLPPANSTSAITNVITIVVGSGPDTQADSRRASQPSTRRLQELSLNQFTASPNTVPVELDGAEPPRARSWARLPPAGQVRAGRHADPDSGLARATSS